MSTINNIPFDINRTATERNSTVKRKGIVPVYHPDAVHGINKDTKNLERRRGRNRRHSNKASTGNKRHLIERREGFPLSKKVSKQAAKADGTKDNAHTAGSIINLEV
jgi:hypothetical protein